MPVQRVVATIHFCKKLDFFRRFRSTGCDSRLLDPLWQSRDAVSILPKGLFPNYRDYAGLKC